VAPRADLRSVALIVQYLGLLSTLRRKEVIGG
jgi:hypothetical protein